MVGSYIGGHNIDPKIVHSSFWGRPKRNPSIFGNLQVAIGSVAAASGRKFCLSPKIPVVQESLHDIIKTYWLLISRESGNLICRDYTDIIDLLFPTRSQ